ncbi:MAG: phosphate ABC transporter permease PstA [Eubacteriales bacterium]|nr:phosphate ABC transporter permease PstA [Eubacteriales bacterium]
MKKAKKLISHPLSAIGTAAVYTSAVLTVLSVTFIIGYILVKGIPNLTPELFALKYTVKNQSMLPSVFNTFLLTFFTLLTAIPIAISSAVFLVEYAKRGSKFVRAIRVVNETLSGIPSIVFGLFGFLAFVISKQWGYSLRAGVITLAIMVLPVIIRTTEEALMSVPDAYREASYGLGAGKLRTIFKIVLPTAMPGIISGIILAIGRIVGETAALIYTAGTVPDAAESLSSSTRTLSVHLYCLLNEGLYTNQAYATAVVLLIVVLIINALSNFLAKRIAK